jgi:hypothetical protein
MKSEIRSMGELEGVDIPPDRPRPFLDPSQHPFRSAIASGAKWSAPRQGQPPTPAGAITLRDCTVVTVTVDAS